MRLAYCKRLPVKMASENSSKDEFETLHYLLQFSCVKVNNNTKNRQWINLTIYIYSAASCRSWYSARLIT